MKTSLLYLLPLALALSGCGGGHADSTAHAALPTKQVKVGTVTAAIVDRGQPLPGTIYPTDLAIVAAKIMATVESVPVAMGQRVRAGEELLKLRADELNARAAQAEAALNQVRRNYERERGLLAQGATTAETVRTLEDELRLAEARLAEARTLLTYTVITAPFDGTITSKNVRRGDLATPGSPLLTIEGDGGYRVHVQVPDSLASLPADASISIETDSTPIEGTLAEWSPAADPASRTRLAKIQLSSDAKVRSGQYVRVEWPIEPTTMLEVPAQAISRLGQMVRVFVVSEDHVHLRLVRMGGHRRDQIQILSGLEEGEIVVLSPTPDLRDGQPVEIEQ